MATDMDGESHEDDLPDDDELFEIEGSSASDFAGFKFDPAIFGWTVPMQPNFTNFALDFAAISGFVVPKFEMPVFAFSTPNLTISSNLLANSFTSEAIAGIMREVSRPLDGVLAQINETISNALRLAPDPGIINRGMLPPTLRRFSTEFDAREVFELVGAEGVPIWSVPRPRIARALAKAPDSSARRQLLNHHYLAILADCRESIAAVPPSEDWGGLLRFADRALASAQAGHFEAGQALLTSTLDTAVTKIVPKHAKGDVISGGQKPEHRHRYFRQMGLQAAYAWLPAWHAYVHFDARQDDDIPRTFSRNATSHAVHRYQYSKRNTAWAALVVTNLLIALARGLVDQDGLIEAAKEAKEGSCDQPR